MSKEPTMAERLEQLAEARAKVELGGGQAKIDKQHEKGARPGALFPQKAGDFRRSRAGT